MEARAGPSGGARLRPFGRLVRWPTMMDTAEIPDLTLTDGESLEED